LAHDIGRREIATDFEPQVFWHFLFFGPIIDGAKTTLELSVFSQIAGIILGLFTAIGRLSRSRLSPGRWLAGLYIWLFRGTPLLVQIAFVYFALPQLTAGRLSINEFWSAAIALSLNEGAYMAEIIRAGISSVDVGQTEAAESLGMTRRLTMRRVVLPQAVRFIIPPTGNEFISMLKNSSLASVISTAELFYQTQQVYSANSRYFELLCVESAWYLAMTTVATYLQGHLERYFGRGFARTIQGPGVMQRAVSNAMRRA
jgi:polar amino acid transport system permease protein